ncbi:DUF4145 domain-containing protein [Fuscovulum blasticum]|uniref:DUF4145 domain-containing protein n=1 Tax=Fuscovulum blasticum TaxID=1075 RepID=UPI000D3EAC33|nr:DUF4145 domain-containing protein [Fuscovulum blasticum]
MKFQIISVRDPVWSNAENTQIDCVIRTSAYPDELPFTASPNDPETHGREIFSRCVSGEFGEIRPYSRPLHKENSNTSNMLPQWTLALPQVYGFIREANIENARNSPRAIGLVWGAMIESMLNSFIDNQLSLKGRKTTSLRYRNGNKCGFTFEGRIDGAHSEGMIESDLRDHFHAIRRIRNACAHEWQLSYENPNVKELAADFNILKSAYDPKFQLDDFESLIKIIFSQSCCQIMIYLAERTASQKDS